MYDSTRTTIVLSNLSLKNLAITVLKFMQEETAPALRNSTLFKRGG